MLSCGDRTTCSPSRPKSKRASICWPIWRRGSASYASTRWTCGHLSLLRQCQFSLLLLYDTRDRLRRDIDSIKSPGPRIVAMERLKTEGPELRQAAEPKL